MNGVVWFLGMLFLVAGSSLAWGELRVVGEVRIEPPPNQLRRGQVATLQYQLTNVGDEPLDLGRAGVEYYSWGPESTILPFPTPQTPPCAVFDDGPSPIPGDPQFSVNMVYFDPVPIPAGGSRTCTISFLVAHQAPDTFVKRFSFSGTRGNFTTPPFGQLVEFRLRGRAAEIPATSGFGTLILAAMILLLGCRADAVRN